MVIRITALVFLGAILLGPTVGRADEGMWTFDNFPASEIASRHGVNISRDWLEHVQRSVVRLSNCTASYVSANGLILTNHHCVASCLAEHSGRDSSLLETGFLATSRTEELRCGTQIADTLIAMIDVTADVNAATSGMAAGAANDARKKRLTELESDCERTPPDPASGGSTRCEAVTLYQGGQYYIYKYRRYDDVRLVFAPEEGIAAFGGDPDNFQFPRWCLDMGVLRAYWKGRPARTADFLKVDFAGPAEGEAVFVAGHPGSTDRLLTVAELKGLRDRDLPGALLRASEMRGRYIQFGKQSESAARIVAEPLNSLENGIKVRRKLLDALHDDDMLAVKSAEEQALAERLQAGGDNPFARIAQAQRAEDAFYLDYLFLENMVGFNSQLFRYARAIVRAAAERDKPNTERLREYTDAALPRLTQRLEAPTPVYPELEQLTLSYSLERMREWLGPDHAVVRELLASDSPDSLASRLLTGSKLSDPAERMRLYNGGQPAVAASDDALIKLAASLEPKARAVRQQYENEVEAPSAQAAEEIARARFAALGTSVYPDATFTLRLNPGTVQGWQESGRTIEPFTRLSRLFERATGRAPFAIPQKWLDAKDRLDLNTPFNLSTNNDIVGGNSGSPLINARGQVVGLMFDGNIHSISGAYWFDTDKNRAVAVDTAIIREALSKVYDAKALLKEIGAGR
ncbi:MAG: S46 family peptidase [Steroidobacteraceae bacterium]